MRNRFPFPVTPLLASAMDAPAVRTLITWIKGVRDWANQQPRFFVEEVTFRAGDTPTKLVDISVAPAGVIVLAFDDVTTGKSAQASQPLRWSFSAGVLTFTSFSGIAGTDVYRLRVLVMEA